MAVVHVRDLSALKYVADRQTIASTKSAASAV